MSRHILAIDQYPQGTKGLLFDEAVMAHFFCRLLFHVSTITNMHKMAEKFGCSAPALPYYPSFDDAL